MTQPHESRLAGALLVQTVANRADDAVSYLGLGTCSRRQTGTSCSSPSPSRARRGCQSRARRFPRCNFSPVPWLVEGWRATRERSAPPWGRYGLRRGSGAAAVCRGGGSCRHARGAVSGIRRRRADGARHGREKCNVRKIALPTSRPPFSRYTHRARGGFDTRGGANPRAWRRGASVLKHVLGGGGRRAPGRHSLVLPLVVSGVVSCGCAIAVALTPATRLQHHQLALRRASRLSAAALASPASARPNDCGLVMMPRGLTHVAHGGGLEGGETLRAGSCR